MDDNPTDKLNAIKSRTSLTLEGMADPYTADRAAYTITHRDAPAMLTALQEVVELHQGAQLVGEPGDPGCTHDDDYQGDRHFLNPDGWMLCADTGEGPAYCLECRDNDGYWVAHPCDTFKAVTDALADVWDIEAAIEALTPPNEGITP